MILLVAVGKMKANPDYAGLANLCATYVKRCQPWVPVNVIELPESPAKTVALAQQQEWESLQPYVQKAGQCLLWTEQGKAKSSPDFAHWVQQQRDIHGFSTAAPWVWIVAGPTGPAPALKAACQHTASLSAMTFPHLVARLLVLEQLYRALAIQHGSAYHK
jgi:23S rRNA (pseudouridine1915-N3)-methyltransferase